MGSNPTAPTNPSYQTLSALHEALQRGEIPADVARFGSGPHQRAVDRFGGELAVR